SRTAHILPVTVPQAIETELSGLGHFFVYVVDYSPAAERACSRTPKRCQRKVNSTATTDKPVIKPNQTPVPPSCAPKAKNAPMGTPNTQYPISASSIGVRVSYSPRSMPAATAWAPAALWKIAAS